MKNLKKVLSLALAFAMVLGLCVGAMAAEAKDITELTDWADVTQKDAAQLLNAFGIMQGDDKGNFNPAKNVTRAEAAKMISVALWGGTDLKDWFKDSDSTFTDVTSADWFAGYVNYAATTGIVAGKNPTTFAPKGDVTGYELLKMALTALGYDQDTEGLVGANWKVNTMRLAIGGNSIADLTKDVKVTNWDLPISRDNTAKVVANMINRSTVKYDRDGYLVTTNTDGKELLPTFGVQYLGLKKVDGTLVANAYGTTDPKKYTLTGDDAKKFNSIVAYSVKDGESTTTATIGVNSDSGLFELGSKATVYLAGETPVSVVVTPATPITDTTAKDDNDPKPTEFTIGTKAGAYYTAPFNFDADGDGKIDIKMTVYFANPVDVNEVVETKNFGTVYQTGGVAWRDLYEDDKDGLRSGFAAMKTIGGAAPAKGDKIMFAKSVNATSDGTTTVNVGVALETVEGKVTRINGTKYYIEGTAYTIGVESAKPDFGDTAVFYTYPGSTIIVGAGEVQNEASKVALIYNAGYTPGTSGTGLSSATTKPVVEVAAVLPDGTPGTYVVTEVNVVVNEDTTNTYDLTNDKKINEAFNRGGPLVGLNAVEWKSGTDIKVAEGNDTNYIVEYTLDKDSKMTITNVLATVGIKNGNKVTTSSTSVETDGQPATKFITSDTVTFIQSKTNGVESWTVYTGRTATYTIGNTDSTHEAKVVAGDYNGVTGAAVKYAVITAGVLTDTTSKSDFYYVLTANGQIDKDKFEYVVYDASADEVKTITVSEKNSKEVKEGDFFTEYTGTELKGDFLSGNEMYGYVTSLKDNILVVTAYAAEAGQDGKYPFTNVNAVIVDNNTKYYVIGDDKTSEKITMADVVAQAPSKEPTVDETTKAVSTPYQVLVTTEKGVATNVIVFVDEQSK